MKHPVMVYYIFCKKETSEKGVYLKKQRIVAEEMLSCGLKKQFDIELDVEQIGRKGYGKPYLKGMEQYQYNISNTEGMVVCAVSDVSVGVDAEQIRTFRPNVAKRCCSLQEQNYISEKEERFFQIWTLKESYIKMIGEGMHFPMQKAEFWIAQDLAIWCSQEGYFVQKKIAGYWISLCVSEEREVRWQEFKDCQF